MVQWYTPSPLEGDSIDLRGGGGWGPQFGRMTGDKISKGDVYVLEKERENQYQRDGWWGGGGVMTSGTSKQASRTG